MSDSETIQEAWQEEMAQVREELEGLRAQKQALERQMEDDRLEREIRGELASEQVVDAEATALLVRQRMAEAGETNAATVIAQLAKEKPRLFGKPAAGLPGRTLGVRQRPGEDTSPLHAAARKAAGTGTPRDVLEYLRVRRQHA